MNAWTPVELMVAFIARTLEDRRVFAQGIATPMAAAAYLLARLTHAPHSVISYTVGNSLGLAVGALSLTRYEDLTLGRALMRWSFPSVVTELLPSLPVTEWFRPAQVDAYGNFNNVVIGPYHQPKVRLPGCGGIADVTTYFEDFSLYVPRHESRVFVPRVDFISGVGHLSAQSPDERREGGIISPGPRRVVTDLCVLGFHDGRMAVDSLHPGVTFARVQEATGFPLAMVSPPAETPPPTVDELELIRETIDPLGIRELERLPRRERQQQLWHIMQMEAAGGLHRRVV
jgi:glutaconate CoA-transferase, subunit B